MSEHPDIQLLQRKQHLARKLADEAIDFSVRKVHLSTVTECAKKIAEAESGNAL